MEYDIKRKAEKESKEWEEREKKEESESVKARKVCFFYQFFFSLSLLFRFFFFLSVIHLCVCGAFISLTNAIFVVVILRYETVDCPQVSRQADFSRVYTPSSSHKYIAISFPFIVDTIILFFFTFVRLRDCTLILIHFFCSFFLRLFWLFLMRTQSAPNAHVR